MSRVGLVSNKQNQILIAGIKISDQYICQLKYFVSGGTSRTASVALAAIALILMTSFHCFPASSCRFEGKASGNVITLIEHLLSHLFSGRQKRSKPNFYLSYSTATRGQFGQGLVTFLYCVNRRKGFHFLKNVNSIFYLKKKDFFFFYTQLGLD